MKCSKDGNIMLDDVFTTSVINILWVMVSGSRFKRGDPQMDQLTSCMNSFMRYSNGGPNFLSVVPFIRFIAPEISGYNNLLKYIGPIRSYIEVSLYFYNKATSKKILEFCLNCFILGVGQRTSKNPSNQFTS